MTLYTIHYQYYSSSFQYNSLFVYYNYINAYETKKLCSFNALQSSIVHTAMVCYNVAKYINLSFVT